MKKIFTLFASAFVSACAFAQVPNDTLTAQGLGVDLAIGSYGAYTSTQASGAEFYAYTLRYVNTVEIKETAMVNDTIGYRIQLRGANRAPFSGIVVTKSDKNVAKVIVNWGANTAASRSLVVYGSTTAYESADSLNAKIEANRGVKLGSTDYVPASETSEAVTYGEIDIEGEYPYVGLRLAATTAAYLDNIIIGYHKGEEIVYDTLTASMLNINLSSGSYAAYKSATQDSTIQYYAFAMANPMIVQKPEVTVVGKDTIGYDIQLRGNGKIPFSGIVMTKTNGHDVKKVIVNWGSANNQNSRTLQVYGSNVAYVNADSLNAKIESNRTTLLGSMTYVAKTDTTELVNHTELEIPAGYPFIGLRIASGASYFNNIIIVYGDETAAIEEVSAIKADDRIFDLTGKEIRKAKSGFYVKGGKKLLVK